MLKKYFEIIISKININSKILIIDNDRPFVCQICEKNFLRLRDLNYHLSRFKNHKIKNNILSKEHIKLQLIKNVKYNNFCWEWQGNIAFDGYGSYNYKAVHRLSYELFNKKIQDNNLICHKCDNPICINPKHLYEGTCQTNMDDMVKRGRSLKGKKNPSCREDVKQKIRKTWICTKPSGIIEETNNLKEYCLLNNINYRTMMEAGGGKGWLCQKK